jgi:hypothetical protein
MWQQKLVQLTKTIALLGLTAALPACADSAATSTAAAATDTVQSDTQGDTQGDSASADSGQSDAASSDTSADTAADTVGGVCAPSNVPCTDDQILELNLLKSVSKRTIVNTAEGNGFLSQVDATAGGFQPTESFLYARFTATGLERVDVSDQAALDSTEWDIAFRRYVVRLNSGVSGPSCVTGGVFPNKTAYDDIAAPSDSLTMEKEAYYGPSCLMLEDGSGLKAPGTVLSPYWKYASCVQMTGKVFQVELADGRKLKLAFTEFYAPEVQVTCNASGTVPQGSVGAKLRLRWAELAK